MFKNRKLGIFSLLLFLLSSILAYWYLNYYLFPAPTINPDGTAVGTMRVLTIERAILLLGITLLSIISFAFFIYQIIRRKK